MQTIGRYEVKGELGRGGMAIVYRAIDPQIGREVAIKVLPREFMQEADFLSRFQREVKTVGQLTHAAIVPLYDAGQDNGQPYLVMRLMGGGSLLDRVRRGALSLAEVVAIFTRLGGALDQAHRKGIIHRDLKPGNILLDEAGLPYLSDFGIVKLTDATSMTSRGAIGTPAYMSPEHFHGKVNARSDVYAMGIILFQLLTGRLPFQAQTPPEYMKAHFMDVPPPLRSVNPNLPTALEPILQRALAKSDEARYASVGELAQAVSQAVSQSASQLVSQPFADRVTVANTPPPMSRPASQPISQSVGQRSASQYSTNQSMTMLPQKNSPWLWLGVGGVIIVMVLLLVVTGLIGLVVSQGETAVVVVTATVQPRATFTATPQPIETWTPTAIAVVKVIPPTDTPVLPTDTPVPPTNTPIPPTDTPVPPTDTPVPPTDTPVPPTDTPVPPTDTPVPPTAIQLPDWDFKFKEQADRNWQKTTNTSIANIILISDGNKTPLGGFYVMGIHSSGKTYKSAASSWSFDVANSLTGYIKQGNVKVDLGPYEDGTWQLYIVDGGGKQLSDKVTLSYSSDPQSWAWDFIWWSK